MREVALADRIHGVSIEFSDAAVSWELGNIEPVIIEWALIAGLIKQEMFLRPGVQ